jgi:hypothetical protein
VRQIPWKSIFKKIGLTILVLVAIFLIWQGSKVPRKEGDWQEHLKVQSKAEFSGDLVTVKNVRNFRYSPTEADMHPAYYDRTYDLRTIKKIWYVTEPFRENASLAHTFLSFEFNNGDFLAITIEARKQKGEVYTIWKGMVRTYPLTYIAADERDVVLMRANVRNDKVYAFPVKTSSPENARLLLADMLQTMNDIADKPVWYNTLWANCTSRIAYHVNRITPGRISPLSWQLLLTANADELALKSGLLDTDLPIEQAREKYLISDVSKKVGDVPNYSKLIRAGLE